MKKGKRKGFVPSAARPRSDINVTPLVDVVLVLLIIFMVVTPLLDKEITVAVPKTEEVDNADEVPAEQLVVEVDKNNAITINERAVPLVEFESTLRSLMDVRMEAFKVIFLVTDDAANYGFVVKVVDLARSAGVKTVATATEAPDAAAPPGPPGAPTP